MSTNQKGFSLLEVLLTIALASLLLGIGLPVLYSYFSGNNLDGAETRITQTIRQAKRFSEANIDDVEWGIYIQESLVTMYQGTDYATRDDSFDQDINFSDDITPSGLNEVYFNKYNGLPSTTGVITLTSDNGRVATITINDRGIIE